MAVPDFSGFTLSRNTFSKALDAIRAASLNSEWEQAAKSADISNPWNSSPSNWDKREQALKDLGWWTTTGGAGGTGGTGGTPAPLPPANPALLQDGLAALGFGAVASGPNYKITSPFAHLYNQLQIDQFGVRDPAHLYRMGTDGKIQQAAYNWWQPGAAVGSFGTISVPKDSDKSTDKDKNGDDDTGD